MKNRFKINGPFFTNSVTQQLGSLTQILKNPVLLNVFFFHGDSTANYKAK